MTGPRLWIPDWQAFHDYVERLRVEHETRAPADAEARSIEAFRRWGVSPPRSFLKLNPEAAALGGADET
jgi:hypothetical protein